MTPRELQITLAGLADKKQDHYDDLIFLAWHIVALDKQKKLPKLSSLLSKNKKAKKQQSDDQMFKIVQMLNTAYSGEVI